MALPRTLLTLRPLWRQVPCLLLCSVLLMGIPVILECESEHVGDNMGTHKNHSAKGPALNHQDAQGGLQIWLFWQVLETGKQEVSASSGEGRKEHRAGRETSHTLCPYLPLHGLLSLPC